MKSRLTHRCLALAAVPLLAGCATQGDLDALKQELQQANQANRAQLESIKGEAKTEFETAKKQLEEREQQLARDLKVLQDALGKLSDEMRGRRGREEELVRQTQALQASVQATNRAMLELLRSQEAQLREQFRQVQALMKELAALEEKPREKQEPAEKDEKQPVEKPK